MKKMFALLLTLALILSLAVPAMAATPVNLTVTHIESGHSFTAYQILAGDVHNNTLSNITWGANVDGKLLLEKLGEDTTTFTDPSNPSFVYNFGTAFKGITTPDAFAKEISGYANNNLRSQHLANFIAETAGVLIGNGTPSVEETISAQVNEYRYTFSNLQPGYYIIVDTTTGNVPATDFKTNYLVCLTSAQAIATKGNTTTTDKTVSPTLTGTYDEILADELNEVHYYKLETAISDNLDNFTNYTLISYDQMSAGLTFLALERVYVQTAQGPEHDLGDKTANGFVWRSGTNGSYAPDHVNTSVPKNGDAGAKLVLGWSDMKKTMPSLQTDDKLVIIYSAKMNENAIIGRAGNLNEHYVDATNGPGDTDIGQTIHERTRVFTFQLDVEKVDAADNTKKLEGAEFYLVTNRYDGVSTNTRMYAQFQPVPNGQGGTTMKLIGWAETYQEEYDRQIKAINESTTMTEQEKTDAKAEWDKKSKGTKLTSDVNGKIDIDGLNDQVVYELMEVKAPDGYNLPLTSPTIKIEYTTRVLADGKTPTWNTTEGSVLRDADGIPMFSGLRVTVNGNQTTYLDESNGNNFTMALASLSIQNNQGNTLPSTGGMGTTILYVMGTIMMLGAAILLITKRRMNVA